ncbi:uncharacterized protein DSM5745_10309 [Aspergillus mulundensis]|uniref:Hydrophobin n=1 Tax=Aspergillus mulundensis TaxID=1810919 RepID=A0A3D8QND5_9EURO|nr:hypothetical protein DSM5745_10309 [Aspergillus mulundensis]RDW63198.1 hypothetical protein DSM5745_10309 [Aspergillus mulundensis]
MRALATLTTLLAAAATAVNAMPQWEGGESSEASEWSQGEGGESEWHQGGGGESEWNGGGGESEWNGGGGGGGIQEAQVPSTVTAAAAAQLCGATLRLSCCNRIITNGAFTTVPVGLVAGLLSELALVTEIAAFEACVAITAVTGGALSAQCSRTPACVATAAVGLAGGPAFPGIAVAEFLQLNLAPLGLPISLTEGLGLIL